MCAKRWAAAVMLGACASVFIAGCAAQKKAVVGAERVVERSASKKPEWILTPSFEQDNMMYFSGGVTRRGNYALGLRQAKAEAIKNLAEGVQARVRTEFTAATQGANISESDLGEFVSDAVGIITENLNIQGLQPVEVYYEKIEKTTHTGVEYFYNCYNLVAIKQSDYMQAREIALNGLADKAKEANNRKAEDIANKLMERLNQ